MATFRVAGESEYLAITGRRGVDDVKLAKKAWVLLGQRCTTLDAAPASYELEAHAATSDKFAVVFRAVYTTVGLNTKIDAADNKLAAPRHRSSSTKKLVNGVVEARVRALSATMTTEQISVKGSTSFAKEVLESVQLDLAKYGLSVCNAADESLAVNMPANKVSLEVVDEEIRAAPTTPPTTTGFWMQLNYGENASMVEASFPEKPGDALVVGAATKKKAAGSCDDKQSSTTAVDVGVHVQMELEGKNDVLLRLTKKFKQPQQFTSKARGDTKVEESKAEGGVGVLGDQDEGDHRRPPRDHGRRDEGHGDQDERHRGAPPSRLGLLGREQGHRGGRRHTGERGGGAQGRPLLARRAAGQGGERGDQSSGPRRKDPCVQGPDQGEGQGRRGERHTGSTCFDQLIGHEYAQRVLITVLTFWAICFNFSAQDSNKVDVEATEGTLEYATTRMKELAGDIGTLMDHVAMDIKDAAEVAKPVTRGLEARAELAKATMEVMSWYPN